MLAKSLELNRTSPFRLNFPAILGILGLIALAFQVSNANFIALVFVGAAIGATLFYSKFGFAGAFHHALNGNVGAFRVHFVMIALASLLFFPLLANNPSLSGAFTPVSVAYLTGAFLFGIGMQLGGGCASGTLFALGGGNARLLFTVLGFVIGSTLGAYHMGFWWSLPSTETVTMHTLFGWSGGLAAHLVILGALIFALGRFKTSAMPRKLLIGGLILAVLNALVLVLSKQPWGEAPAFALWGSKIALFYGYDVEFWDYWVRPAFGNALEASIFKDSVSVLDFSIVLGAMVMASLTGEFKLNFRFPPSAYATAILGGLLMGYGARLANGCNIGAYFSGLASGSLSAWAWLAFALLGSYVILKIKLLTTK
jgi:uncharacterized protein